MKRILSRKSNQLIILLFLALLLLLFFLPFQKALVFYKQNTKHIAAYLPVEAGDKFQIIFKHSIHLTDVIEKYKVTDDNRIQQYEMVYEQFGIGMPSNAEEGQSFVYEDGKYHIKGIDTKFDSMNIRNGKVVSEHRLVWGKQGEHMVWFNDYFIPGEWYKVKIKRLSLWQVLKGVKIHDEAINE
ncbi:DUF1850 domain-containing protein [Caldibacillus lycopersici]|uniref:DUF1850 domain-containing protein n=1 Tax=Perspicuibacillus lycopersici TaxID=1325689 RepID=A0AAE3IV35_9BACI|nr:DUF1850 domain-containing protein [Perspicuibacillus lycopersici]MCU9615143.1 DUF1850 domain-containing protein [Perspicuibacillus lycopersici]